MRRLDEGIPSLSSGPKFTLNWMSPVVRWTTQPVFRDPPVQEATGQSQSRSWEERIRRAFNFSVALVSIVGTIPLFITIAVAVKLTSRGPVFYVQERVGLNRRNRVRDRRRRDRGSLERRQGDSGGKVFRMIKFRTMYVGSEQNKQVWASKNDPRITTVGKVLRAFRLDELPQLFNVLMGDMNIVGPRPEQPKIFQELRSEIPEYPQRQKVLPGITGRAQVNNGYDRSIRDVERKLGHDLEYLEKKSLIEDFKIMAKTVPVVLKRIGYH